MNDTKILTTMLMSNPKDVTLTLILADALQESGYTDSVRYLRVCGVLEDGGGVGGGGGGGGDGGGGVGDGGGGGVGGDGGGGGSGGDGGGVGDGGGGGGVGDGGVGDGGGIAQQICEGWKMYEDGLYLLSIKGGYYPYVIIGWVTRHDFMLTIRNSRVIKRFGGGMQLSQLASGGPRMTTNPTVLLDLSPIEYTSLPCISRLIPANPKKWAEYCPKPKE